MRTGIRLNLNGTERQIRQMTDRGQYALAQQVYADSNRYAPKLTGDLRQQSFVTFDNKHIEWNVPYAARMYYNQYRNYTTPGTGPKWVEKANAIHRNDWIRVIERAMTL